MKDQDRESGRRQGLPRKAAANKSSEPKENKENGAIDVMWSGTQALAVVSSLGWRALCI